MLSEPLPPCPKCAGRAIFTGNEKPDGRWVKTWKHHYLCTSCNATFHKSADYRSDQTVGEGNPEVEIHAEEPQEQAES